MNKTPMKMQAATLRAAPVIVVSVKSAGIFLKKSIILRPLMVKRAVDGALAAQWISLRVSQVHVHADARGAGLGLRPLRDSLPRAITAKLRLAAVHALGQNFASPAGRPRGLCASSARAMDRMK